MSRGRGGTPKRVSLALQGGAANGAFAWGVLDRLLEEDGIEFEGVAGTSSGAINAALMAYGLIGGDRSRARNSLRKFWRRISEESEKRRWTANMMLRLLRSKITRPSRKEALFDVMSRILLPYDFEASTMNPLRSVIDESIDFPALRAGDTLKLFVNATNIATNKNQVFDRTGIGLDTICASCCLPFLFDAVEIDGERYWDGGYMGNPTIYPLIYECETSDIVMVLTSPIAPRELPVTSADILTRISQISFTSAFMREMRAIAFVTDLLERNLIAPEAGLRKVNMHVIAPPAGDPEFAANQRFNAEWRFLERMCEHGRAAADAWLRQSLELVGVRSSIDLAATFID